MNRFIKKIMLFPIFLLVLLAGNNVLAKTTTVGTCEYTSYNLGAKDFYLKMDVVQYSNGTYQLVLQDDSFYYDSSVTKTIKMKVAVGAKTLVWNNTKLKNKISTSNLLAIKTSDCPEAVAHVQKDGKLYIFFGQQNNLQTVTIGSTAYDIASIGGQIALELKKEQEAKNNAETITKYKNSLEERINKLNNLNQEFLDYGCYDEETFKHTVKNGITVFNNFDKVSECKNKLTTFNGIVTNLRQDVDYFKSNFPNETYSTYESSAKKFEQLKDNYNAFIDSNGEKKNDSGSSGSDVDLGEDILNACEVVPPVIKKWIINILKIVRYIALALVIVLGALDFMKAAGSGEPDQMKKAGQSFLKRVIAVAVLFLLPYIVELVLGLIDMFGVNTNCMDPGSI